MLIFEPNPVLMDIYSDYLSGYARVQITSLSGTTGHLSIDFHATSGGLSCSLQNGSELSGPSLSIYLMCQSDSPQVAFLNLSANQAGTTVTVQPIIQGGQPVCTSVGEPCGFNGDCCVGLSCQAIDGGCACLYAWPANK